MTTRASLDGIELTPPAPRPFVKWAGGKGSLVGTIGDYISHGGEGRNVHDYRRYVEPFVGAGAMLYWVRRSFPHLSCSIRDSNDELIRAYRAVRDHVHEVIAKLETHQMMHSEEHYYKVRSLVPHSDVERAARFIYLNRTCYNGLYRVNRKGEFNVPMGSYRNPKIVDRQNLLAVSSVLMAVELEPGDFSELTDGCGEGDVVYLDPPYDPISETSQFTSYTKAGFGRDEQLRLRDAYQAMTARGARVILSNSDTPFIRELYASMTPTPVLHEVNVPRSINSKGSKRAPVKELLICSP